MLWTLPSFTPGSLFLSMLTLHSAMLSPIISQKTRWRWMYTSAFLPMVNLTAGWLIAFTHKPDWWFRCWTALLISFGRHPPSIALRRFCNCLAAEASVSGFLPAVRPSLTDPSHEQPAKSHHVSTRFPLWPFKIKDYFSGLFPCNIR